MNVKQFAANLLNLLSDILQNRKVMSSYKSKIQEESKSRVFILELPRDSKEL